jgi:hypothetical protein
VHQGKHATRCKPKVKAEGHISHDEDEGDQNALERGVAQLSPCLRADPLGSKRCGRNGVITQLSPQDVHELIASAHQGHLNTVVSHILQVGVVISGTKSDPL